MEYLSTWTLIVVLMLFAAMAPGPDFVLAIRNSLTYSRRTGIFTALGFGLGVCVHVTYCILGIAAIISRSILVFNVLKFAGAAYLIYIGWHALRSKGFEDNDEKPTHAKTDLSIFKAIRMGFLTNLLNPKATMFFLALFTQVINPHTPLAIQMIYGATTFLVTVTWFSFVALVMTHKPIKTRFLKFSKWIDRVCGGVMIAFGCRLAFIKGMHS